MCLLDDLKVTLNKIGIPFETGVWSKNAPDKYIVIVPLDESFDIHCDNKPEVTIQEARISLFCRGNYVADKDKIIHQLFDDEYTITYATYIGFETETKYHHFVIEVANYYERNY